MGKVALLVIVLLAAAAVARTCGSSAQEVTQEEAVAIASDRAGFEPCVQPGCVVVRALRQGIPSRLYWVVGLAERVEADGRLVGSRTFIVDVTTGEAREQP